MASDGMISAFVGPPIGVVKANLKFRLPSLESIQAILDTFLASLPGFSAVHKAHVYLVNRLWWDQSRVILIHRNSNMRPSTMIF